VIHDNGATMRDDDFTPTTLPTLGWQQRRAGIQFYFCCCPLMLLLAPFVLVFRLARYGVLLLLGRPATSPWASTACTAIRREPR
jgi:hypothetical protein